MKTIKVVVRNDVDVELASARKLDESEKSSYSEEYKDHIIIGIDHIKLPFIRVQDLSKFAGRYWYTFPGSCNTAYEVSGEEWNALIQLNASRAREEKEKERRERIEYYEALIRRAESQKDIPTEEEAHNRRKRWNDLYNEGGEGYIPSWVTAEQYRYAKEQLCRLREEGSCT